MATETLKLMRSENSPWGFRLSGGKDFGVILTVQKVSSGSIAADTGLKCGDVVLAINGQDTTQLRHKEAQDAIVSAGNVLEITVQRGGVSSFKPSIAKQKPSSENIQNMNQYNGTGEPQSLGTIARTLTAHAEMIAPGVMGINFMKPEHPYNTRSEVYRLVQEQEQIKAKSPTPPTGPVSPPVISPRRTAPIKTPPPPVAPKPAPTVNAQPTPAFVTKKPAPPPAQSVGSCSDCGRYITSAFVRVGERMLHEDCFRCSTCGTSLQNSGYASINNKLYCELHAKLAAKVIVAEMDSMPSQAPADFSAPPPPAPICNAVPPAQVTPSAAPMAPTPFHSTPISVPAPYVPPGSQSLANFPQTPSSSGGLTFRSISPQPFKRISGDFHRVNAPSSPTPSSGPSFIHDSTGCLPFEAKPYMPATENLSSYQASSQMIQSSHMSQTIQQTTMVSQQSSQFQMDYKQVVGQQSTKFVWPPPKPEDILNERKVGRLVEESSNIPTPTQQQQQHYSPLATQSSPPENTQKAMPQSMPETPVALSETPAPHSYVPPPLPTTHFPKPEETSLPSITPITESRSLEKSAGSSAPGFAPVLPPVVDTETKKDGLSGVPQSGVPTGAGSRAAPRRGKGQLKEQSSGCRIPICADCGSPIRGPFIIALGKTWCPEHFHCNNLHCKSALQDIGFVEEQGQLYCENCYEAFLAPICNKCGSRIKGDCLNALDKSWHPECFLCAYCHKPFGNSSFYLEDGLPYCEKDWNELFTTKCVQCGYPIEAGDRWVEALNNNYHSQCFKCSICSKNLEGQSFFAKGGRPFCKAHAR